MTDGEFDGVDVFHIESNLRTIVITVRSQRKALIVLPAAHHKEFVIVGAVIDRVVRLIVTGFQ